MTVRWKSLGFTDYDTALAIQEQRAAALLRAEDEIQTLYSVEHPPTITIGRNGSYNNIVASRFLIEQIGIEIREVDRGGDVTYHGPGQCVLYPVLHLSPWGNDVGHYIRLLERMVIHALAEVDIPAQRLDGYPGVWIDSNKVCAIGARVKRRLSGEFVTSHGIALNVNTDLSHFSTIIPCGIQDKGVTSVQELAGGQQTVAEWEERLVRAFARTFDVEVASDSNLP